MGKFRSRRRHVPRQHGLGGHAGPSLLTMSLLPEVAEDKQISAVDKHQLCGERTLTFRHQNSRTG